jgi:hypothetical protein
MNHFMTLYVLKVASDMLVSISPQAKARNNIRGVSGFSTPGENVRAVLGSVWFFLHEAKGFSPQAKTRALIYMCHVF